MKRRICIIIMFCIYCANINGTIYGGKCGENATWTFDFDREVLTISGFGDMTDYETREDVPWDEHRWKIGRVVIGDSITLIGTNSFYVLSHCNSVTLGKSLVSIHEKAFNYCKGFVRLVIPDKVRYIDRQAFVNCSGITSLYMGESVESVGGGAFSGLNALNEVQINSFANWLKIKFENYSSNPLCYSRSLSVNGQKINKIIIPEGVDTIRKNTFCNLLIDTLSLPSTLKCFEVGAFIFRDSLKSIVVDPSNVVYDTRGNCNALIETATNRLVFGGNKSIIPNDIIAIGDSAFYGCTELPSITFPEKIHSIGKYALANCEKLKDLVLPNLITDINDGAFSSCNSLQTVTIPDNVVKIGYNAFYSCASLKKVVLSERVSKIGGLAFCLCSSLDSIICLSNEVPDIAESTFSRVKENGMIICPEESDYSCLMKNFDPGSLASQGWRLSNQKKPLDNEIWYTTTDGSIVNPNVNSIYIEYGYFPETVNNSYFNGMGSIRFKSTLTHLPNECFKNCSKLESIVLPDSIENIYSYVFSQCKKLKTIHLPDELRSIHDYCFSGCESLDSLYIPGKLDNLLLISETFNNIPHLRKVVVSNDNKVLDSRDNCNAIIKTDKNELILGTAETVIPLSVKAINDRAFYGNTSLKSIVIPDSVTTIGNSAFYGCTGLQSVELPNSLISIGEMAFFSCDSLKYIDLPNSITSIGNSAFSGCDKLVFLDLPNNIGFSFPIINGCPNLKHITMGENIVGFKRGAIIYCDNLQSITIPNKNVPYIYNDYNYFYVINYNEAKEPGVIYRPTGSDYSNFTASLSYLKWTEDTIPEKKNNELWYRTTDGEPLLLNDNTSISNNISNRYEAGYGIIRFENPVTRINNDAFKNNEFLTSMVIPSTVESIDDGAFAGCENLRTMTVEWDTPLEISDDVFDNSMCKTLYVPQNTRRLYEKAPGWRKFQKIIQPYNYVEWVKFSSKDYSVKEGDTLKVNITVFPDDAVIRDLDWYSSDETIATVKNGMVIGKKVGQVYIKAVTKDGSLLKDSCLMKVTPVLAEKVLLDRQNFQMLKNHTVQLIAEVLPERTTYKDVIWKSSNESIVKVESGIVTALKKGVADITATTTDGTLLVASCEVKVEDYFPGDVNWDAEFNIGDVTGTISFIMEKQTEGLVFEAADMNNDGIVLVNDLKDVLDIIMGANMNNTLNRPLTRSYFSHSENIPELVVSDYQTVSKTTKNLRIGLIGANNYTGIQCDIALPRGISISQVYSGLDLGSHQIAINKTDNGMVRIAVYSMNNECFSNDALDFLVLDLNTDDSGQEEYEILFMNTIASTVSSKTVRIKDKTVITKGEHTTGIHNPSAIRNEEPYKKSFNLKGIMVDDNYKGIVVKKGKKTFVK